MTVPALVDYSPQHPSPAAKLDSASNLILIDNYDSFTWNVYQYLVLEGATVSVFRNDKITLEQLIQKNPTQLVISPGPGHPDTDAGLSCEAIRYFSGKIPVLGVCMGEQCIFAAFGGSVDVTGEILHGKTSPLSHDGKGMYAGLPQSLPVTRYHSLAGTHASLPECLEVSSWIEHGEDIGKGIIMGVRHKTLVVEGVQFHPESILTAEGRLMLKNFLHMQGGTWAELEKSREAELAHVSNGINGDSSSSKASTSAPSEASKESILETIYRHRRATIENQKMIPSQRMSDFQQTHDMDLSPPVISFAERLRKSPYALSLLAEIKRASPSKGLISMAISAPLQARKYAKAGASVISVLTEPEWFKGSIDDLRAVRRSLEGMPSRPAVLRKDFIFDEYQILEARVAGADSVLLIVKMLDRATLERLYKYSQKLGMEPLVEVNTAEEMTIALSIGAEVIGINNRNLTSFEVDLGTTSRLMSDIRNETFVCALSGITGPEDVEPYKLNNVKGVLVGEALMKARDVDFFVAKLLGSTATVFQKPKTIPFVKICGIGSPEMAKTAIEAGADLIGMIRVEGRKRTVSSEVALEISKAVRGSTRPSPGSRELSSLPVSGNGQEFFELRSRLLQNDKRALLVGVFQNQPLDYVLSEQARLNLDVVQLHGSEPIEWARLIPVPVFRRFGPEDPGLRTRGYHTLPLLDVATGGTGQMLNPTAVASCLESDDGLRVALAGGLTPENVGLILKTLQTSHNSISVVDVSSGVEDENGSKSPEKIRSFVKAVKTLYDS